MNPTSGDIFRASLFKPAFFVLHTCHTVTYQPFQNIACGYASQDVQQHIQDWQVRKFRCYFLFSIFPWNMGMELALQLFGNWLSSRPCSKKPKHEFREEGFNLGPVFFASLDDGKRIGKFCSKHKKNLQKPRQFFHKSLFTR